MIHQILYHYLEITIINKFSFFSFEKWNFQQPAIRVSTLYAINAILRCQDMSTERIKHFPRKKKTKDDLLDRIRVGFFDLLLQNTNGK